MAGRFSPTLSLFPLGRWGTPDADSMALGTTEAQPWHGHGATAPTVTPSEPGAWGCSVNICRIEGAVVSVGWSFASHRDGRQ